MGPIDELQAQIAGLRMALREACDLGLLAARGHPNTTGIERALLGIRATEDRDGYAMSIGGATRGPTGTNS